MNPTKLAWEVPALRSEKVQETLTRAACQVKISLQIGSRGAGPGVAAQALFS